MNSRRYLIFIGTVIVVFSLGLWLNNYIGMSARAEKVSYLIDEEQFQKFFEADSTDILQQNTYVINVWATWCKPCLEEIPELNKLKSKYQDNGFTFVAPTQEEKTKVDAFILKRNDPSDTTRMVAEAGTTESGPGVVEIKLNHSEEVIKQGKFHFDYTQMYGREDLINYLFSINPSEDIRAPISNSDAGRKMMPSGIPLNVIIHKGEILFYEIGYDQKNIRQMDEILSELK